MSHALGFVTKNVGVLPKQERDSAVLKMSGAQLPSELLLRL